jgi:hypothetical protein
MAIREAAFGIITSVFKRHGEQQQQQRSEQASPSF